MAVTSLLNTPANSPTRHPSDQNFPSAPEAGYMGPRSKTGGAQYTRRTHNFSSKNETNVEKVSQVYSIERLKEINQATKDTSVLVKVKPEAISENLFQYLGIRRERRHTLRPRGLSHISTFSCSSDQSNLGDSVNFSRQRNFYQPLRQPCQPPPFAASQKKDGFLRFLQQHASPPHHRVTAGGRIVPAGPFSPPPMFDFASLNGMLHSDGLKAQEQVKFTDSKIHLAHSSNNMFSHAGANSTGAGYMQMPVPPNCVPYLAPLPSNPQAVNVMAPLGQLSDGTPLVSYNGLCYRTFWSNDNIVMEPLTLPVPTYHSGEERAWNRPPQPYNPTFSPSPVSPLENQMSSTSGINLQLPRPKSPITSEQLADSAKEALLRQELADLNVYMALHHDVIEPDERLKFVEKRKHLVGRLDHIRASREPSSVKMPIVAPININRHAAIWTESAETLSKPNSARVAPSMNGEFMRESNEQGRIKKTLSPNAPSFVPSGLATRNPAVNGFLSTPRLTSTNLTTPKGQEAVDGRAVHTPVLMSQKQIGSESNEEEQQYSPPDARDPAMRIIHRDDIKYAANFETSSGAKQFCTTIEEFQEAIRQVREQARLYGCAGGSSKDPAYDAEQDIWWAICDHDPIPLPTVVPDYLARPRPWDWNDSAFNVRCIGLDSVRYSHVQQEAQDCERPPSQSIGRKDDAITEIGCSTSPSSQSADYKSDENPKYVPQANALSPKHETFVKLTPYDVFPWLLPKTDVPSLGKNVTNESAPQQLVSNLEYSSWLSSDEKFQRHGPQEIDSASLNKKAPLNEELPKKIQDPRSSSSHQPYVEDAPPSPIKSGHASVSVKETQIPNISRSFAYRSDLKGSSSTKETDRIYKNDEAYAAEILKVYDSIMPSTEQVCRSKSEEFTTGSESQLDKSSQAMSKTVWGPEEVKLATHKFDRPESAHNAENCHLASTEMSLSRPRVSIPSSHGSKPLYGQRFYPSINGKESMCPEPHIVHDANFVEVTTHRQEGQPDVTSPSFLQDMLKNPKYTYDFRHVDNTPMDPSTAWQIAKREKESRERLANLRTEKQHAASGCTSQEMPNAQASNKENRVFPHTYSSHDTKRISGNMLSPPAGKLQSHFSPKTSASKSNSSLASSTYQARGYLPPYEGAGRAHTSTIFHQHGCGLQLSPRVNLPQTPSRGGINELNFPDLDTKQKPKYQLLGGGHDAYNSFGLDGNAEAPSKSVSQATKGDDSRAQDSAAAATAAAFDTKGVTQDDFDTRRADPNNPAHHTAVDDFFRDLHRDEVKKIRALQKKNEKKGR